MTESIEHELAEVFVAAMPSFGLPDALPRTQADRLASILESNWNSLYGKLGLIDGDLSRMKRFFDPVATGHRLREEIAKSVTSLEAAPDWVPVELMIRLGEDGGLITPEGRCVIDLLRQGSRAMGETVFLPAHAIQAHEARLLRLYRDWGRHRISGVVALLAGEDKPLQLPAAGALILLLVNRSTCTERAIYKKTDNHARQLIDDAFFSAVYSFADAFGASGRRDRSKEGLVKGWTIGEVRRRFDRFIVSDSERLYVRDDMQSQVVTRLGSELARRRDTDEAMVAHGFDDLVMEMRRRIDVFASYGMAHERPRDTKQLRADLLAAYRAAKQL
ncbi:hypothetical protein [Microbispora sp. CA-102843]|uniref:hypothetical protein n=1 Tax=Microbispora sp. CA-102843 TaxID=3239952 RepID=UPI003D91FF65